MRRSSFRIERLLGLDRNRVSAADDLAPDHLVNLTDARGGGFTPAGAWPSGSEVSWSGYPTFVGSDAMGLASVRSGATGGSYRYGLVRDAEFVQGSLLGGAGADSHYGAHIPGVGAYASVDRFLVQDRSGNIVEPGGFSSGGGFVAPRVNEGVPANEYGQIGTFDVADLEFDGLSGRWVAVGGGLGSFHFGWRDGTTGDWTVGSVSIGATQRVAELARTASYWIAAGPGGLVMRSADGESWEDISFGSHNFVSVAADPGSGRAWLAVAVDSSAGVIHSTTDSGDSWGTLSAGWLGTQAAPALDGVPAGFWFPVALAFDPLGGALGVYARGGTGGGVSTTVASQFRVLEGGGTSFRELYPGGNYLTPLSGGVGPGRFRHDHARLSFAANGQALLTRNHEPPASLPRQRSGVGITFSYFERGNATRTFSTTMAQGSALGFGEGVWLQGEWWLTDHYPSLHRFVGVSLDMTSVTEDLDQGEYYTSATDGSVFISAGAGGVFVQRSDSSETALGRYEVVLLTSVMTSAGKLVVHTGEHDFRVAEASRRTVSSHSFGAPAPAFAGNVTTDVYVRFTPRVFDEESGQWVIHEPVGGYTHAASLAGGQSWDVDAPGVGSQVLGISGGVAVAAFRNSDGANVSAEHNARVWFQSGPGFAWDVLMGAFDFPMLEDERVVTFSVGGFVNLVELDGWLRLAATQSDSLTGMLPSPQGLLIFFDNETFSLSGDVALQNLQALLFPDNVGLSAGNKAVLAGGVPISLWRGKLWALQGGQAQDVAQPVWRADDPFVDVVSEPLTRSIVALTDSGELLSMRTDSGFWFEVPRVAGQTPFRLMGNPDGFRVWNVVGGSTHAWAFDYEPSVPVTPEVAWLGLDAGDALRRDNWLNVRFMVEGEGVSGTPVLYYRPTDARASVPSVFSRSAAYRVVGRSRGDEWWFKLPVGLKSRRLDVLFVLEGFGPSAVLEPGVSFLFVAGHVEGRRPQL